MVGVHDQDYRRLRRHHPEIGLGRAIAMAVMVVGIVFLSLLIGSVSERFVTASVSEEVAEEVADVEREIAAGDAELLAEIRGIGERLRDVEDRLARRV